MGETDAGKRGAGGDRPCCLLIGGAKGAKVPFHRSALEAGIL